MERGKLNKKIQQSLSIYALNTRTSIYVKQIITNLKGVRDKDTTILRDFSTFKKEKIIQTINKKGNTEFEQYFRPIKPNRHTQTIHS